MRVCDIDDSPHTAAVEPTRWECAAILFPFFVTGSNLVMAFTELWFVTVLVGLPLALAASIRIRCRRRAQGDILRGLEGIGWLYVVLGGMTTVIGLALALL
jgi:hypothetical protein